MSNASTLESLNIEITANASSATGSVNSLTGSLRPLAKAIGTVIPALQTLNRGLRELARYGSIKVPQIGQIAGNAGGETTSNIRKKTAAIQEQTTAIQKRINAMVGIDRVAPKRASAEWWETQLGKRDLSERQDRTFVPSKAVPSIVKEHVANVKQGYFRSWMYGPNKPINGTDQPNRLSDEELKRLHPDWYASATERAQMIKEQQEFLKAHGGKADWAKEQERGSAGFQGIQKALEDTKKIQSLMKPDNRNALSSHLKNVKLEAEQATKSSQEAASGIRQTGQAIQEAGKNAQTASPAIRGTSDSLRTTGSNGRAAAQGAKDAGRGIKEAGDEAKKAKPKISSLFEQIGRMMKTMLIRTAIRNLIKAFGAAWNAAYQFSHNMGGGFAKSVDQARTILANVAMTVVQTFAPVFQALVPILYVVAEAFQYVCQGIQYLLSLLGMTSDLFGVSLEKMGKFYDTSSSGSDKTGKSAKKAAKEVKNLLASWDELNIIQSASNSNPASTGGGGGGSGYKPGSLKDLVKSEISAILGILVGEALMAVGLILVCTGHYGAGLGLMALGAASIAKTLIADWKSLPNSVRGSIAQVMAIAGGSLLGIGLILALTGANIPIGLSLMALGASSMAASIVLTWNLDRLVKRKVAVIAGAVGGALLAVGAVLAFTGANIPLGVALMAAGALSIASAVALTWDLDATISEKIATVTAVLGGAVLGLGAVLAFTGANIPLGIGLMLIGAASLAGAVALTWDLDEQVKGKIAEIATYAGVSLLAIGAVLAFTGASLPVGIGMMLAGAASLAAAATITWGLDTTIKQKISKITTIAGGSLLALGLILVLTGAGLPLGLGMILAGGASLATAVALNWDTIKEKVKGIMTGISAWFVKKWADIKRAVELAWNVVSKWWTENIQPKIDAVWNPVKELLKEKWDTVKTAATEAWNKVSDWWTENVSSNVEKEGAWGGVKGFFKGLFVGSDGNGGIYGWSKRAFNKVNEWTKENLGVDIKAAFEPAKTFLHEMWVGADGNGGVKKWISDAWTSVDQWLQENTGTSFSDIWTPVKTMFNDLWTKVSGWASGAWTSVKKWWQTNVTEKIEADGIWGGVKGFFAGLWGSAAEGTGIAGMASNAWKSVKGWWAENVTKNLEKEGIWGGVKGFFKGIFVGEDGNGGILGWSKSAYATVSDWFKETTGTDIETAWGNVQTFFKGLWEGLDGNGGIKKMASDAFSTVSKWWNTHVSENIKANGIWGGVEGFFKGIFVGEDGNGGICGFATSAFNSAKKWWNTNVAEKLGLNSAWGGVTSFFEELWGTDSETGISGLFSGLWGDICKLWGDIIGSVEAAWKSVSTWFYNNVTRPIGNFFINCVNGIIDGVNWLIGVLNSINITIPGVSLPLVGELWGPTTVGISGIALLEKLDRLEPISENANGAYGIPRGDLFIAKNANGAYGIPRGDLFIANEAGAELVGSMNGKTTVANQGQIIEGIQRGVADANSEQNRLLQEQNSLLRQILQKSGNMKLDPSLGWSRFNQANDNIYAMTTGR